MTPHSHPIADAPSVEPRQAVAQWTRVEPLLWGVWVVYSLGLGFLYAHQPPSPDLATFDYAGWIVRSGGTPYVDVIEQNWPGAIALHTVSSALFGNHLWSFRVLDFLLMSGAAAALWALLRRSGQPLAGWVALFLHQVMYVVSDLWIGGQRDIFAAHVLLLASVGYVRRLEGGARGWAAVVGLATTFVTLTRPTYLLFPLLLFGADALLARRNGRSLGTVCVDVVIAGAASLGSLLVIVALAASSGALEGFWQAAILFNTQLYSGSASSGDVTSTIASMSRSWHWYLLFGAAGAVCMWRRGAYNAFAVLASVFLLGLLSAYAQGKAFGYHLSAWMIAFSGWTAELVAFAVQQARQRRTAPALGLALVVCSVVAGGAAKKVLGQLGPQVRYALGQLERDAMLAQLGTGLEGVSAKDLLDAAAYSRKHTTPEQTVLTWGRAIEINYLAQRRLPTPFATVGVLDIARPPFEYAEAWLSGFEQMLEQAPPALVFAPSAPTSGEHKALFIDDSPPRGSAALRTALAARYEKRDRFGSLDAYVLRPQPSAAP